MPADDGRPKVPVHPLTLALATKAAAAAQAQAQELGCTISVAVVDESGRLVYFARVNTCSFITEVTAIGKAKLSVSFRRPTHQMMDWFQSHSAWWASLSDPAKLDVQAGPGAFPLVKDGVTIGAIGCGGGIANEDDICAQAGAQAINRGETRAAYEPIHTVPRGQDPRATVLEKPLTFALAQKAVDACRAEAAGLEITMSLAIVDDAGRLALFERGDTCVYATEVTTVGKAIMAAGFRRNVRELEERIEGSSAFFAGLSAKGKLNIHPGGAGYVLTKNGVAIGGIGTGGGTGEEDDRCARAGAQAMNT